MVLIFLSVYLTKHLGYDIRDAGYIMTSFGLGALGGMWLGGMATDRFGYFPVMVWSLLLNGVMLIGLLAIKDFWPMCIAVFSLSLVAETFRPANQVAIK